MSTIYCSIFYFKDFLKYIIQFIGLCFWISKNVSSIYNMDTVWVNTIRIDIHYIVSSSSRAYFDWQLVQAWCFQILLCKWVLLRTLLCVYISKVAHGRRALAGSRVHIVNDVHAKSELACLSGMPVKHHEHAAFRDVLAFRIFFNPEVDTLRIMIGDIMLLRFISLLSIVQLLCIYRFCFVCCWRLDDRLHFRAFYGWLKGSRWIIFKQSSLFRIVKGSEYCWNDKLVLRGTVILLIACTFERYPVNDRSCIF